MSDYTQAALQYMRDGAAIINTASVTAYQGAPTLIDYSSTKGAIVSFTRALSNSLVKKKIRVNAVAPGRPAGGSSALLCLSGVERLFLYVGQVLHPDGGTIVNS
jgi:NAD(P)-dependent dehydrogenase (short-subunit alcohol dehydrogenase family)